MIKSEETFDTLNLQDDKPKIMFGPWAQASLKSEDIPPFYISLTIHDMFLHNAMFDLGASHNLMPITIIEGLRLDITRPYKDLFSFDSISTSKCPKHFGRCILKARDLPSFAIGSYWP